MKDRPGPKTTGWASFWVTKGRKVHRVKEARALWPPAVDATYRRPRVVVDLECRRLGPQDESAGLRASIPAGVHFCARCFPRGPFDGVLVNVSPAPPDVRFIPVPMVPPIGVRV